MTMYLKITFNGLSKDMILDFSKLLLNSGPDVSGVPTKILKCLDLK